MKINSHIVRNLTLSVAVAMLFPAPRASAQAASQSVATASQAAVVPARITQAIDETQLVRLKGNVHPLARPEFDRGVVPDGTPMNRMLLLLQRSPEQEAALQQLMTEQMSKDSPNFHKWLTPAQFGAQFGPSDADIQVVTDWLSSRGFHDIKVGAGRGTIEFSGNVGLVRNTFQTEIHHFFVNGEMRQANVSDPQIPAALTPV
ncbi:MAG TPA: protease pro-enzyme activation domain-containing protein, partial [Terriglobales bacterium]|nr:protease pro-enzyme activation domain-containing protein [Terriglobales bacterium]